MKKFFATAVLALAASPVFAQSAIDLPNLTFPTESNWSIYMVEQACQVNFGEGFTGEMARKADGSVRYSVYDRNGNLAGEAKATNGSLITSLSCL